MWKELYQHLGSRIDEEEQTYSLLLVEGRVNSLLLLRLLTTPRIVLQRVRDTLVRESKEAKKRQRKRTHSRSLSRRRRWGRVLRNGRRRRLEVRVREGVVGRAPELGVELKELLQEGNRLGRSPRDERLVRLLRIPLERSKDDLGRVDVDLAECPLVRGSDDAHDLSELVVVVPSTEERVAEDHLRHALGGREGQGGRKRHQLLATVEYTDASTHMQPALQMSMLVL